MGSRAGGFSLIELAIVCVIIAILAAIAVPRLSSGAEGAGESKLAGDLESMRKAIELYRADHLDTAPTLANIVADLTLYSDTTGGSCQANLDATHFYGPYLRAIPGLSVGQHKGATGIGSSSGPTIGWIYDETTGTIRANTSDSGPVEADRFGRLFSSY